MPARAGVDTGIHVWDIPNPPDKQFSLGENELGPIRPSAQRNPARVEWAMRKRDATGAKYSHPGEFPEGLQFFQRGDYDERGSVGFIDATRLLRYCTDAALPHPCPSALDIDDDDVVDLGDAIQLLRFLFLDDSPPALPFPGCGPDLNAGVLECDREPCKHDVRRYGTDGF